MEQFLALEREVREALQGVSLTSQQLDGIGAPAGAGGADVDPGDLRATEAMLLDLLGADTAEGSFQDRLAATLGGDAASSSSHYAAPALSSFAASAHTGTQQAGGRQQQQAQQQQGSKMEDLARELNC
jgi:hypothetical protein